MKPAAHIMVARSKEKVRSEWVGFTPSPPSCFRTQRPRNFLPGPTFELCFSVTKLLTHGLLGALQVQP